MRSLSPLLLTLLAAALAACNDPDFERQSELARVRVLAVRTTPAELTLDPDGGAPPPLALEALVTPEDGGVGVSYALCLVPDVFAPGVECPGRDGLPLDGGSLDLGDPALGAALSRLAGGADGGALDLTSPAVRERLAQLGELSVGYLASDGSGGPAGSERGVRRIPVRLTASPNRNPEVEEVLVDGAPLGTLTAGREVVLRPRLADGSLERFEEPGGGGARTEAVFYSWHATGEGEVEQFRSLEPVDGQPGEPTVEYAAPLTPGPVTLYVVARDGRGGVGWLRREVQVVAPAP